MEHPLVSTIDRAAPEKLLRRARGLLARLGAQGQSQSYWTTFWLPRGEKPAHALEELVLALQTIANPPASCAGAEWWIGRAHTTRIPVGFHFDQDVKAKRAFRHPKISSVFFFNPVRGGQLAITDQIADDRGNPRPAQAGAMAVVKPARNRYAIFAGNLFHGVLDANGKVPGRAIAGPPGRLRITLVINYWEKRPTDVPRWEESRAYSRMRG